MLVHLQNVGLQLRSMIRPIVSDIDYKVEKHDFVILLGSNGSGKTSLLKLLNRTYVPTTGKILFNGKNLLKLSQRAFSKKIVTLTQNALDSLFPTLTVLENCLLAEERGKKIQFFLHSKKNHLFFAEYLHHFNPELSHKLDTEAYRLSGGEQQALALALSMLYPPDLLLLDEHTSALDPQTAKHLMTLTAQVIAEKAITCIMTTHDLTIAEQYGNRILALKNGQMFRQFGTEEKVSLSREVLLACCY